MAEPKFQESKKEFCKDLIAAREFKELDIEKVSERTKISLDYLQNLENGDWDFLPVSYVRAFMSTYAQTVGLDVGEVLQRYDSIVGKSPSPQPKLADSSLKRTRADSGNRNLKFTLADDSSRSSGGFELTSPMVYGGIAVIAIAILLLLWFYVIGPMLGDTNQAEVEEIPFEEVVRESQTAVDPDAQTVDSLITSSEEPSDPVSIATIDNSPDTRNVSTQPVGDEPEPTEAIQQRDQPLTAGGSLTLRVDVTQACYMRVIMDHDTSDVFDTILSTGSVRSFEADSVYRVVVGNTNGVSLFLNGRELRDIGRRGRVVTLTIDETGVREALAGNRDLR